MVGNYGFTEDTEVLTTKGWTKISDVLVGCDVLSYNIENGSINKDIVLDTRSMRDVEVQETYHKSVKFSHGTDQQWYGWKRMWAKKGQPRLKKFHKFSVKDSTQECNILVSAVYKGYQTKKVAKADCAFLGWLLSDGYYKWSEDTRRTASSFGRLRGVIGMIAQAQHKFYKEVEDVIAAVNIPYKTYTDSTGIKTSPVNKYYFEAQPFRSFMDRVVGIRETKLKINWIEQLLCWSDEQMTEFLYHFWLADGDSLGQTFLGNKMVITQNKGSVMDAVALCMFLQGRRVSFCNKSPDSDKCKSIRLLRNAHLTLQETSTDLVGQFTTFDILTSKKTYIIRQGDFISITCSSSFNQ